MERLSFLRRLTILEYLRHSPESRTSEQIIQHLLAAGILDDASTTGARQRLIQRDMQFLFEAPIAEGEEAASGNPYGLTATRGPGKSWSWHIDRYADLSLAYQQMPQFLAVALSMARKHLITVLPQAVRHELQTFFLKAEARMEGSSRGLSPKHYQRLRDAIEFYQRGQRLQAQALNLEVLDAIYRSILLQRRLLFSYRGKSYEVNPLGIAILLPKVYLVATKHEDATNPSHPYEDPRLRHFLVHRIENLLVSDKSSRAMEDFNLKDYLEKGYMDLLVDPADRKEYRLRLEITPSGNLLNDLRENPVGRDQTLVSDADGHAILTVSTRRTIQLLNWILSLGPSARVLQPTVIQQDLSERLRAMLDRYP